MSVVAKQEGGLSLGRFASVALLVGIVFLLISLAGIFGAFGPDVAHYMLQSYHFGWVYWLTLSVGSLGLTLLAQMLQARWALPLIRIFEAGSSSRLLWLLAVLFVPILFSLFHMGLPRLYEWADPEVVAHDAIVQHKLAYLNPIAFTIRFVLFIGIWAALANKLRLSGLRQEKTGEEKEAQRRKDWGAGGTVAFVMTLTFAFTDWVMSLDSHWYSTIYGVWFLIGGVVGAMALATLLVCVNVSRNPYAGVVNVNYTKDWGNLLFAFSMFWAYTSFSQFLIIWNGNLPEFNGFYVDRDVYGWGPIGMALMIGHFFVPFMALLSPRIKRSPRSLAKVAGLLFVMHLLDVYWIVVPSLPGRLEAMKSAGLPTILPMWTDLVALLAVGGIWVAAFSVLIRKTALLPSYDPRLKEEEHSHA